MREINKNKDKFIQLLQNKAQFDGIIEEFNAAKIDKVLLERDQLVSCILSITEELDILSKKNLYFQKEMNNDYHKCLVELRQLEQENKELKSIKEIEIQRRKIRLIDEKNFLNNLQEFSEKENSPNKFLTFQESSK